MCGDSSNLKVIQADTLERFPSKYCLMTGFFRCSRSLKVRGVWARKTTISIMLYNQPGPHRESRISGLEVLPGRFCTVLLLLCDYVSVFFLLAGFLLLRCGLHTFQAQPANQSASRGARILMKVARDFDEKHSDLGRGRWAVERFGSNQKMAMDSRWVLSRWLSDSISRAFGGYFFVITQTLRSIGRLFCLRIKQSHLFHVNTNRGSL